MVMIINLLCQELITKNFKKPESVTDVIRPVHYCNVCTADNYGSAIEYTGFNMGQAGLPVLLNQSSLQHI